MNKAFSELSDFEFQNDIKFPVRTFLVKFDAIFSLNQDLLLETHYLNDNILLGSNGKWDGWQIPGMRLAPYLAGHATSPIKKWVPNQPPFEVSARHQPYFKLHGSIGWRDGSDQDLLVMGENKGNAIASHDILKWYYLEFSRELSKPNTRLMIIGYSFGDFHINGAIFNAITKGQLQVFIIDPRGPNLIEEMIEAHNSSALNFFQDKVESVLQQTIIGASRRPLHEIFGINSSAEHSKVMRFFN